MCILQKVAALMPLLLFLLFPCLARCFAIPDTKIDGGKAVQLRVSQEKGARGFNFIPEIIEYNQEANVLKFKISCLDCIYEERQRLSNEVISIEFLPTTASSCTPTTPIGLSINGQKLNSDSRSPKLYPAFEGSLASPNDQVSILNHVRWFHFCGCSNAGPDGSCNDAFDSVLVLEVLGMRGHTPGFTLSHRRSGDRRLLRISNFPDAAMKMAFERSLHWRTPLLGLQEGSVPTSTLLSSFSSVFPSFTVSALSPEHTSDPGHVIHVTESPSPTTVSSSTASPSAPQESEQPAPTPPTAPLLHLPGHGSRQWPITSEGTISALEHGLETLRTLAQDAILASLHKMHHCSKDEAPQGIRKQGDLPPLFFPTPSNTARATIPTVTGTIPQSESIDVASTPQPLHVISPHTIKAFQIAALVIIVLVLCTAIFVLIRRNPRLRAEMAARSEERRNKRLYRRAACNYRWQTAFKRFRSFGPFKSRDQAEKPSTSQILPSSSQDCNGIDWSEWNEKRVSVESDRAPANGAGIREGLSELRRAHRFVDGMVSAEEGHSGRIRRAPRHQRTWSDSASSEKTAPPPYDEEYEEIYVANGIRYVRRNNDTTPDSSVIDTSPRSSVIDSDSESEKD